MKAALTLLKIAIYGSLALAPLHDARGEEDNDTVPYATIKDAWDIVAHRGANGASDSCMATAYYPASKTSLNIMLTVDQQAYFGIVSPAIANNLIHGKSYTFTIYVNGKVYNTLEATVNKAMVSTTVNIDGLNTLMEARSIGFETGLLSLGNFNLQYSHAAITKVQECVAVLQHGGKLFQEQEQQPSISADPISSTTRTF